MSDEVLVVLFGAPLVALIAAVSRVIQLRMQAKGKEIDLDEAYLTNEIQSAGTAQDRAFAMYDRITERMQDRIEKLEEQNDDMRKQCEEANERADNALSKASEAERRARRAEARAEACENDRAELISRIEALEASL